MQLLSKSLHSGVVCYFACAAVLFPHASWGQSIPRCKEFPPLKSSQGSVVNLSTQQFHHYFREKFNEDSESVSPSLATTTHRSVWSGFRINDLSSIQRPREEEVPRVYADLDSRGQVWSRTSGLNAGTRKWTEEVRNNLPIVTNANSDWRDTIAALENFPLNQKIRILTAARLTPETARLDFLSTTELQQRVSLAKNMSDIFMLEKALHPDAAKALLYPQLVFGTPAELRELIMQPKIQFSKERYVYAQQNAYMMGILEKHEAVMMVGGGRATHPGELAGVSPGEAVWVVTDSNGVKCFRPSQPVELLLDPSTMHVARSWDPTAFPDVGLLMKRQRGANVSLCSFVRISRTHILTAAHCVSRKDPMQKWKALQLGDPELEVIAIVPNFTADARTPEKCFDSPDKCGFFVTKLLQSGIFPGEKIMSWVGGTPNPDIALVPAVFPLAPPPSTALGSISSDKDLTLAGYGFTNVGGKEYAGYLQVGWNKMPNELNRAVLVWDVLPHIGYAGACNGDSGGAVFSGSVSVPSDKRELIGLISFGVGDSNRKGVDFCMTAKTGVATRLQDHLPWICDKLANQPTGCPGS